MSFYQAPLNEHQIINNRTLWQLKQIDQPSFTVDPFKIERKPPVFQFNENGEMKPLQENPLLVPPEVLQYQFHELTKPTAPYPITKNNQNPQNFLNGFISGIENNVIT